MSARRKLALGTAALAAAAAAAVLLLGGEDGDDRGPAGGGDRPGTQEERRRDDRQPKREREGRPEERETPGGAEPLDGTVAGAGGRALAVGIGDQKPEAFQDPRLRALGVRRSRLVMAWNAPLAAPADVDRWIQAARAAGTAPLVAFSAAAGSRCPADPCRAPSVREFARSVAAFRRRWPDVTELQPWNEANHGTQPTARRPRLAAAYYDAMREECTRCTVVAADVLTAANMASWLREFRSAARHRPRLWGLHNYPDTNRFTAAGTEELLRLTEGDVWITETGGIVEFATAAGRVTFPYDERRAARATRQMLRLARSDRRIARLYVYQWQKTGPQDRFDAGLVAVDGRSRPALAVLRREIAG
jgi:hypothetical protein